MSSSFFSKVPGLRAGRYLNIASNALGRNLERLSSGMRINRASDDAAGLAISEGLNTSRKVFQQAMRNANDAISALSIADSAIGELKSVLTRMRELATQAANGSYTLEQRRPLDEEAAALSEEFNRIIASTTFNDIALLEGDQGLTTIQLGFGLEATISIALADELERNVGDGSFQAPTDLAAFGDHYVAADFDGDGDLDYATGEDSSVGILAYLNNGDGTFTQSAALTLTSGGGQQSLEVGDFDNDGIQDLIAGNADSEVEFFKGNGDGTFELPVISGIVPAVGNPLENFRADDFNGDGNLDFLTYHLGEIYLASGNGDGTFDTGVQVNVTNEAKGSDPLQIGDFNGDGKTDFITTDSASADAQVYLGNGAGGFSKSSTITLDHTTPEIKVGDFNHDGYDDIVAGGGAVIDLVHMRLSNGDGTFSDQSIDLGLTSATEVKNVADMNGDGLLDVVTQRGATLGIVFGDGEGGFAAPIEALTGVSATQYVVGDFSGDGAMDLLGGADGDTDLFVSNTDTVTTIPRLDLLSADSALEAFEVLDDALERLANEGGVLGANLQRLSSAISNLASTVDNYGAAESRIRDADIAAESAELVRNQILQQTASAVLAQANQSPSLVLQLLSIS